MRYETKCEDCKHVEIIQRKHDEENPPCSECSGKTRNVIHVPNIIMKGDGWASKDIKEDRNLEKVM